MKTGNTDSAREQRVVPTGASMEPGHEDREYEAAQAADARDFDASMEPGHEDREYMRCVQTVWSAHPRLNGARS